MGNETGNLNLDPPHYKSQKASGGGMGGAPYGAPYDAGRFDMNNHNPYGAYQQHQSGGPMGKYQQQNLARQFGNNHVSASASDEKQTKNKIGGDTQAQPTNPVENAALDVFNSEAMNVCWVFWKDNVDILPRNKQKELALLLYCHMFQKIPAARRLFIRGEIDEQALKFLDMFGYLIRQLKDYESVTTLIKTLQSLGKRHKDWGVRFEYFEPMMSSLHAALSDHFKHTYTVRVKFCMEQIFTSAANIMTGQNVGAMFGNRYAGMGQLTFLQSLEACLADPTGKEYLERFLIQSFCAELVEFESYYKQYKGALSDTERYILAATIVKLFLTPNAKNELNIKNMQIKQKILKKIDKIQNNKGSSKKNKQEYPSDLFDHIHDWVIQQIESNSWPKFQQTISSIAYSNHH
eukprot:250301_1